MTKYNDQLTIAYVNISPSPELAGIGLAVRDLASEPTEVMVDITITDTEGDDLTAPISEIPLSVIFDNGVVDVAGLAAQNDDWQEMLRQAILQRLTEAGQLSVHRTPEGIIELRLDIGDRHYHGELNRRASRRFFT